MQTRLKISKYSIMIYLNTSVTQRNDDIISRYSAINNTKVNKFNFNISETGTTDQKPCIEQIKTKHNIINRSVTSRSRNPAQYSIIKPTESSCLNSIKCHSSITLHICFKALQTLHKLHMDCLITLDSH